jgi:hypothetical protein
MKKILLAVFASLTFAAIAAAQDVVTVQTVSADGPTVEVPVFIRDTSGTPLGVDRPAGSKIQSLSIKVNYSPAAAVSSVTFTRAGITANLMPAFETSPSTSGSISLLVSFSETTSPIPFTSNAALPGDQVARLVFQLSGSATPGTPITLTLDSSTTQLSNQGGTTTETQSNGGLALTNGSIQIPIPTLSLTPPTLSITAGSNGLLSAETNQRLVADTTVTLSSSNPVVATVPASVTISAGGHSVPVQVTALSPGSTTITATLPASSGGSSSTAAITVTAAPVCNTPAVPVLSGPATATVGTSYSITWAAVADASEYIIDEATDAAFNTATPKTVSGTSASYSHTTAGVRFFYRIRARNHAGGCDVSSPPSASVSVLITAVPAPPPVRVLAVVGSTPGSFGSFFKTSLQLYNPKNAAVSGKIVFHTQATSGSSSDPSLAYSILPGKTLSFGDLLPAMGIASGLGSADLVADATSALPLALSRVFNDAGAAGTTGLAQEAVAVEEALQQGNSGALLAPTDIQKFRLNIGVRTLDQGAALTVTIRDKDGGVVKTLTKTFPATFFTQVGSANFLDGFALTGGETISFEMTSGAAFIYGATTDNVTNDPSVQLARKID